MTHPLPFIARDPMQSVVESTGAAAYYEQLAQERLHYQWEKTPAGERSEWPPSPDLPGPDHDATPLPRLRGAHLVTASAMTSPPALAVATVPTPSTPERQP